jgi:hypothetical protein
MYLFQFSLIAEDGLDGRFTATAHITRPDSDSDATTDSADVCMEAALPLPLNKSHSWLQRGRPDLTAEIKKVSFDYGYFFSILLLSNLIDSSID